MLVPIRRAFPKQGLWEPSAQRHLHQNQQVAFSRLPRSSTEQNLAVEQLHHHTTQRPDIDFLVVATLQDALGSSVLKGPDERGMPLFRANGRPEVNHFDPNCAGSVRLQNS